MILENGVVRTLDPSLPVSRALAVAGDRIAGGVGVHETALASPETVDLGGRCVLPGFTDSHTHFPTWAVAQHEVKLDGCASLEEALERGRTADAPGTWLRGYGWRSGDWGADRGIARAGGVAVQGAVLDDARRRVRRRDAQRGEARQLARGHVRARQAARATRSRAAQRPRIAAAANRLSEGVHGRHARLSN